MSKKLIAITGPSAFTENVRQMVTEVFNAIPLDIHQNGEDIAEVFKFCDALILSGGCDIEYSTLGRELTRGNQYTKFDKQRDLREIELIRLARESGKQILGICRGHQLLLSQAGLPLLPDLGSSDVLHRIGEIEVNDEPVHYLHGVGAGKSEIGKFQMVNSYHHQGIYFQTEKAAAQRGIEVLGISTVDYEDKARNQSGSSIIEFARGEGFISVQFHPEIDFDKNDASKLILSKFAAMIGQ